MNKTFNEYIYFDDKIWNYNSILDYHFYQNNSISINVPISTLSSNTFNFYSNENYKVLELSGITSVNGVSTINLTQEDTSKFIPGIVSLFINDQNGSKSYLVGECFKRH